MDIFPFIYHKFTTEYQTNSVTVPLGGGYQFTPKPTAPALRQVTLKFSAMAYLVYKAGFDQATYMAENPDVAADAGFNAMPEPAWYHFSKLGFLEQRSCLIDGQRVVYQDYARCVGCLELFYLKHQLWDPFIYKHPAWGDLTVRFSKPLVVPENNGPMTPVVGAFDVVLLEQG